MYIGSIDKLYAFGDVCCLQVQPAAVNILDGQHYIYYIYIQAIVNKIF